MIAREPYLDIIYQDNHLLRSEYSWFAFCAGNQHNDSVMESGKKKIRFCEPAHRLDMWQRRVLCLLQVRQRIVVLKLREREPKKHYQAFVFGGMIMASGANDLWLGKSLPPAFGSF